METLINQLRELFLAEESLEIARERLITRNPNFSAQSAISLFEPACAQLIVTGQALLNLTNLKTAFYNLGLDP